MALINLQIPAGATACDIRNLLRGLNLVTTDDPSTLNTGGLPPTSWFESNFCTFTTNLNALPESSDNTLRFIVYDPIAGCYRRANTCYRVFGTDRSVFSRQSTPQNLTTGFQYMPNAGATNETGAVTNVFDQTINVSCQTMAHVWVLGAVFDAGAGPAHSGDTIPFIVEANGVDYPVGAVPMADSVNNVPLVGGGRQLSSFTRIVLPIGTTVIRLKFANQTAARGSATARMLTQLWRFV